MVAIRTLIVLLLTFLAAQPVHADPVTLTITEGTVLRGYVTLTGNLFDTTFTPYEVIQIYGDLVNFHRLCTP